MNSSHVLKYVYSAGGQADEAYLCCWDDCPKRGTMLHLVVVREGEEVTNYIFCSDRHKQYYINSHVAYGKLPDGYRANY